MKIIDEAFLLVKDLGEKEKVPKEKVPGENVKARMSLPPAVAKPGIFLQEREDGRISFDMDTEFNIFFGDGIGGQFCLSPLIETFGLAVSSWLLALRRGLKLTVESSFRGWGRRPPGLPKAFNKCKIGLARKNLHRFHVLYFAAGV